MQFQEYTTPRAKLEHMASGKSHAAIAADLGISRQYVQALLAGTRKFSNNVLARLGMERVELFRDVE